MKLSERLMKTKEEIKDLQLPFEIQKAEKDLEKEIIQLKQDIATLELKIEEHKNKLPFILSNILSSINERELKQRALNQAIELQNELF